MQQFKPDLILNVTQRYPFYIIRCTNNSTAPSNL